MTDDPSVSAWVEDRRGTWHASIAFDGDEHELACGLVLRSSRDVADARLDGSILQRSLICGDCCDAIGRT